MGRFLQFRCENRDCPTNYRIMVVSSSFGQKLIGMGAFEKPSVDKCQVCGQIGLIDIIPQEGTPEQRQLHNELLEDTMNRLRGTAKMLNDLFPKKDINTNPGGEIQ